ncbi:heterokaryon incompatibility protein-domain-containing protein [Xylogone sp. PMI_703]|nr:heterokaryon incompatibility protein-domain-containing protein [Xylogone sp. PMI_703]
MRDVPRGIAQQPYGGEPSRERSIQWAQSELSSCLKLHQWCQSNDTSFVPTRLINVSLNKAGGDVFLEDSSTVPPRSQYVTLSYCWGGVEPDCMTTREILVERQRCIPWATLPQTFKDAIEFTRILNIPYIWIDGVCIIQKDTEDWLKEGGKMFHVYKNSYCTIAAAGESPLTGLWPTSTDWKEKQLGTLKLKDRSWPLYARTSHDHYWEWDVSDTNKVQQSVYPLFRRAWTYQERLISPRVILFMGGEKRDFWQNFGNSQAMQDSPGDDRNDCTEMTDKRKETITSSDRSQMWRQLIEQVSRLSLTQETDRLLAVGAVAEQVQATRTGEDYLAGLWSGSLLQDLLWKVTGDKRALRTKGPSWSWASWAVGARGVFWYHDSHGLTKHSLTTLTHVVECKCTYSNGNPFGTIDSGKLVLQGRLLSCRALCVQGSIKMLLCERVPLSVSAEPMDEIKLDAGLPESGRLFYFSFSLLEIGIINSSTYFLVLQAEDKENGPYTRIGVARFRDAKVMNRLGKTKVVTIE